MEKEHPEDVAAIATDSLLYCRFHKMKFDDESQMARHMALKHGVVYA
jgi:hypothetical protein